MNPYSLHQHQAPSQSLKQVQRLMMSPKMQQAIHLMQLPVLEMQQAIEQEMEQNPVLELIEEGPNVEFEDKTAETEAPVEEELSFDDNDLEILKQLDEDFRDHFSESQDGYKKRTAEEEKRKSFLEQSIREVSSLYEYLIRQARETFEDPSEFAIAEVMIGYLDDRGFYETPLEEIALLNQFEKEALKEVLKKIQEFDPTGVGARDLQESLLIQLKHQGKQDKLAYRIVENFYQELLKNKIPLIAKKLQAAKEEVRKAIDEDIAKLDLHPGAVHSKTVTQTITSDAAIMEENGELTVRVNQDYLPPLRLNSKYLRMLEDETLGPEERDYIKKKVLSAKWLIRNIDQRNGTLESIAYFLAKWQRAFFLDPRGDLTPLTMTAVAEELGLHESTVARCVSSKYIETPRGLLPLRFFFTSALGTTEGDEVSSDSVRRLLAEMIDREDKARPLSDAKIAKLLEKKGVQCARRTVAKFRNELGIGNTRQRKVHQ